MPEKKRYFSKEMNKGIEKDNTWAFIHSGGHLESPLLIF